MPSSQPVDRAVWKGKTWKHQCAAGRAATMAAVEPNMDDVELVIY